MYSSKLIVTDQIAQGLVAASQKEPEIKNFVFTPFLPKLVVSPPSRICARKKNPRRKSEDHDAMARQKTDTEDARGNPCSTYWEHLRAALAAAKGLVCVCVPSEQM